MSGRRSIKDVKQFGFQGHDGFPVLSSRALQGLAGRIVRATSPHTEADPVALLLHLLAAFGNIIGDRPCFRVGDARHPLRLFVAFVGRTAKARKGLAWNTIRHLLALIDRAWLKHRVTYGGLSS